MTSLRETFLFGNWKWDCFLLPEWSIQLRIETEDPMPSQRPERRLFTDKTAMDRLGLSRTTFYRYLQKRAISQPVGKIGKNRRGWTDQDIEVAKSELHAAKRRGELD